MGRRPKVRGSKKGFKQLNAKVPAQLLLEFNNYWQENADQWDRVDNQGRRDDLIVIALKELMNRKPPRRAPSAERARKHASEVQVDPRDAVISFARKQAEAIVDATRAVQNQKQGRRAG